MKYYLKWLSAIVTLATPFLCFTAAFLHAKTDPNFSTLFTLLGLYSLDSMNKVEIPKRDSAKN
jgi:hypothetical protein